MIMAEKKAPNGVRNKQRTLSTNVSSAKPPLWQMPLSMLRLNSLTRHHDICEKY